MLAAFNLGCMLYAGKGGSVDKYAAAQRFHQAALMGHANAAYNLGCMFFKGDGLPKNDTATIRFLTPLGNAGDTEACMILGYIYYMSAQTWIRPDVATETTTLADSPQDDQPCASPDVATETTTQAHDDCLDVGVGRVGKKRRRRGKKSKRRGRKRDTLPLDNTDGDDDDCPICIGDLEGEPLTILTCGHTFHKSCTDLWVNKCVEKRLELTCPLCRSLVVV
jgi:hypothetical protein